MHKKMLLKSWLKKWRGFALLDAEEALAKVVLFTIISELLVHESDEGSRSGKDLSGYPVVIDGLVPSVDGSREVLAHEGDVGKVS
jgi:hypothetical protein